MRKLKLQVQMSLDGFIADTNSEMSWLISDWDAELKNDVFTLMESVDTILLGRKLAEGFIPYWASHPEEDGAEWLNATPKIVFTQSLTSSPWENSTLATGDLVSEIKKLKAQEGSDLIAYGGADFVSALIKEGLVDEFHLLVDPTVLGSGMPIFASRTSPLKLRLKHSHAYACGITVLCYAIPD